MTVCLIGLGSNQGNRQANLQQALQHLQHTPGCSSLACSSWHTTTPVGGPPGQNDFLNAAVRLETSLPPQALLARLLEIENLLGRQRLEHWGPRPIDLDLLLYEDLVLNTPSLVLPHPRMAWRRFVLEPAAEVAADLKHPQIGWTVGQLLAHLNATPPYVAITGPIAVGKSRLAERLAQFLSARYLSERPNWSRLEEFYREQAVDAVHRPAGSALETELEFLHDRAQLLAKSAWDGPADQWTISDFWFDQSAAFAEAWLIADQFEQYRPCYERLQREVVRPRLVVCLDLPVNDLLQGVRQRGRDCEQRLTAEQLERIGETLARRLSAADVGPALRAANGDPEATFSEVAAAVQAMQ